MFLSEYFSREMNYMNSSMDRADPSWKPTVRRLNSVFNLGLARGSPRMCS